MKCQFCNVYGVCIKYSNIEVDVPCSGDYEGCLDFTEEEDENDGSAQV